MPKNGNQPHIFGRNYHKGITPGGFSQRFKASGNNVRRKPKKITYDFVIEAANIVLEGRQMPRAEEKAREAQP